MRKSLMSFGLRTRVTAASAITAAATAIVHEGMPSHPTLVKQAGDAMATPAVNAARIVSASTSAKMRGLLRVAVTQGTGHGADVPGYSVGGKTGTAEKSGAGGYRQVAAVSRRSFSTRALSWPLSPVARP